MNSINIVCPVDIGRLQREKKKIFERLPFSFLCLSPFLFFSISYHLYKLHNLSQTPGGFRLGRSVCAHAEGLVGDMAIFSKTSLFFFLFLAATLVTLQKRLVKRSSINGYVSRIK